MNTNTNSVSFEQLIGHMAVATNTCAMAQAADLRRCEKEAGDATVALQKALSAIADSGDVTGARWGVLTVNLEDAHRIYVAAVEAHRAALAINADAQGDRATAKRMAKALLEQIG